MLADIIARLRLNAQGFGTELTRELNQAERRFGASGSVIGRNLSTGIQSGLQNATAQIPVLGGALSGLSGVALGVGAAAGGIALALAHGVREAEALQQEIRRLDGVLQATGNNTGFDSSSMAAFAEQMETSWAVAAESIIRAQGTLAMFDNVSGPTFERAIRYAADLSAVFGTDLASNAQNLGQALQNLGNGDVEGLNRGFRFLGTETLNTIRTLAEAGQTAEAQEALFAALERRVGGSAERGGEGLTAAFFRLTDSVGDLTRRFAEQTGLHGSMTQGIDSLATSVNNFADRLERLSPGEAAFEGLMALQSFLIGGPGGGMIYNRISGYARGDMDAWGNPVRPGGSAAAPGASGQRQVAPASAEQVEQIRRIVEQRTAHRDQVRPYSGPAQWSMAQNRWVSTFPGLPLQRNPEWASRNAAVEEAQRTLDRLERQIREQRAAAATVRQAEGAGGVWPVSGQIRSGVGMRRNPVTGQMAFHNGVDIRAPTGTPVRARYDGIVEEVEVNGVSGRYIRITHAGGRASSYAHLSAQYARPGQRVSAGDVIGAVGSTGRSTGPHLHYRETLNGQTVDPLTQGRRGMNRDAERAEIGQLEHGREAGDRAAREAQQQAERRAAEARRDAASRAEIVRTGRETVEQEAERARIAAMRAQGLEREAELEEALVEVRSRYEQQIQRQPEQFRAAEAQVTAGLAEQLTLYEQQATAHAALVRQSGDQTKLTEDQRTALAAAATSMQATLTTAQGMATTLADQREIAEALATAENRRTTATQNSATAAAQRAEINRKDEQEREEAERHLIELQQEAQEQQRERVSELAGYWERLFSDGVDGVWDTFERQGMRAIAELAAQWTLSMMSGQRPDFGLFTQSMAGGNFGPLGSILGSLINAGGKGGGAAAGATGGLEGLFGAVSGGTSWAGGAAGAGGALGGLGGIGAALGTAMPYVGAALAVFSTLQSLGVFKSTKRGSSTLGFSNGELGVGSTSGNSREFIAQSSGAMKSVGASLERIAEALGGSVTGAGSVSLGQRDGDWRGDPTGRGITKKKKGAIDFGDDEEAAVRWAIGEALRDGVLGGISDAAKRIMQGGGDLEKAIAKALLIEEIPKKLKARLDPVGAALDDLTKRWDKTIAALKEGGATAEQMAEAQQLYNLELEETKTNTATASASLKEFLAGLKMGPDSPYSLRDQEASAKAALQPFLDKIGAGEGIDQEKYQAAAQTFLDIERQLYGSTGKYFEGMDAVMAATSKAIEKIDNAAPIRTVADPFIEQTAANTLTMAQQLDQMNVTMAAIRQIFGGSGGSGGSNFIGSGGGFNSVRAL